MNERRSLTTRSLEEEEEEQLLDSYCTPAKVRPQTIAPPPQTIAPPLPPLSAPKSRPFPPPPQSSFIFFQQGPQKRSSSTPENPHPKRSSSTHSPYKLLTPNSFSPRYRKPPWDPHRASLGPHRAPLGPHNAVLWPMWCDPIEPTVAVTLGPSLEHLGPLSGIVSLGAVLFGAVIWGHHY